MDRDSLKSLFIGFEGLNLKPYLDTEGRTTIGYGRCLSTKGISEAEASILLDDDLSDVVAQCRLNFAWFSGLTNNRQNIIACMVFQLGLVGVQEFKQMIICIVKEDWNGAADAMLQSQWQIQTPNRAKILADMMKLG